MLLPKFHLFICKTGKVKNLESICLLLGFFYSLLVSCCYHCGITYAYVERWHKYVERWHYLCVLLLPLRISSKNLIIKPTVICQTISLFVIKVLSAVKLLNAYSTYVAENFHDEYENKMICLEKKMTSFCFVCSISLRPLGDNTIC